MYCNVSGVLWDLRPFIDQMKNLLCSDSEQILCTPLEVELCIWKAALGKLLIRILKKIKGKKVGVEVLFMRVRLYRAIHDNSGNATWRKSSTNMDIGSFIGRLLFYRRKCAGILLNSFHRVQEMRPPCHGLLSAPRGLHCDTVSFSSIQTVAFFSVLSLKSA